MLKPCKYSRCAVCKQISEREIFKSILKTTYPDIYICEHAKYRVTNINGGKFILPSLECISKGKRGYFVQDMYTTMLIYLDTSNFEVLCSAQDCTVTPHVTEYIIR